MVDYPYTHYLDPSAVVWGQSLPNYPIKCVKRIKRALSLALFAIYYFCQSTSYVLVLCFLLLQTAS